MTEIIPAILEKSFDKVSDELEAVHKSVRMVQIDVCDGKFVPSVSWPFVSAGVLASDFVWKSITSEEEGMPYWDILDFELDLMITDELLYIEELMKIGPTRIVIHLTVDKSPEFFKELRAKVGSLVEIGIAVHAHIHLDLVAPFIETGEVQFVQCMGIRKVGFQHEPFDLSVVEVIKNLKKVFPEISISVDGGVSLDNARLLIDSGATRLVVGSAIFASGDVMGTIEELKKITL